MPCWAAKGGRRLRRPGGPLDRALAARPSTQPSRDHRRDRRHRRHQTPRNLRTPRRRARPAVNPGRASHPTPRIAGALFDTNGEILWLGRSRRHASAAQQLAVAIRDRGCVLCRSPMHRCRQPSHRRMGSRWRHTPTSRISQPCATTATTSSTTTTSDLSGAPPPADGSPHPAPTPPAKPMRCV